MKWLALVVVLGSFSWTGGCNSDSALSTGQNSSAVTSDPLAHLLITEVAISNNDREFIEIYNPSDTLVDLSNYYLSDDDDYALLPAVFGGSPAPYVNATFDFVVKFPDGATIASDQAIVVAMRFDDFQNTTGVTPDYAIRQATGAAAMIDPSTLTGATGPSLMGTNPQITNSGEGVVLFHWDGSSDLVQDIDMVAVSNDPASFNRLRNKTALAVDGPDGDTTASTYGDDDYSVTAMSDAAGSGFSHKRIALEPGFEQRDVSGNGLLGDDETSENIAATWDSAPFTAPTPGVVPGSLSGGLYCGDGILTPEAGEECDDGNNDNGDGCTSQCRLPSCDDGLQNADEIDVDCGGHCGPGSCSGGQVCYDDSDCAWASCTVGGTCALSGGVTTGGEHTCVLRDNGAVRCWGANYNGQLGQGNRVDIGDDELPSVLGDIDLGGSATHLVAGRSHTCALLDDGAVRCWGDNNQGQLGYGNRDDVGDDELPAAAGDVDLGGVAVQITAGFLHTCALLDTGVVRCWGWNGYGQLGYGHQISIGDDETPASAGEVQVGGTVASIVAGGHRTCAVLTTGDLRCWGQNTLGLLGMGNTDPLGDDETPDEIDFVPVGGLVNEVSMGSQHTCAIMTTGAVRCWGLSHNGQLGYGNHTYIGDDEPASTGGEVALGGLAVQIATGTHHSCAILEDATLRCWGWNEYGQLGYGHTNDIGDTELPESAGPVQLGGPVDRLGEGFGIHLCAIMETGAVRCWGRNNRGQLGHGTTGAIGNNELPYVAGDVPFL